MMTEDQGKVFEAVEQVLSEPVTTPGRFMGVALQLAEIEGACKHRGLNFPHILRYDMLSSGLKMVADGGFTCLDEGQVVEVGFALPGVDPFVVCRCGTHTLDGQQDVDNPALFVGFKLHHEVLS